MSNPERTIIESLGAYLPPKAVTTQDVVKGCSRRLLFPLERVTGIKSRRVAGETEFSYHLAAKAVEDCFAVSRHGPADIDLVVACNISRYDGPDEFSFEPSTASKLRMDFGLEHAAAFDITNACAGTFTGIYVVDALVRAGAIRRGLVVSGEYITHLTETAQKEISGLADSRVPCLTLGDAGIAVIVEGAADPAQGFQALELFTIGRHSDLCIAKVTDQPHGGAIMKTDMIKLAELSVTAFFRHAASLAMRLGWSPQTVDHVLPHQTSKVSLSMGSREIKRAVAGRFEYENKVIDNVEHRGNTATTSHILALKDCFLDGRVTSGQSVVFGILASGITVGTALHRFDDLPERVRRAHDGGPKPRPPPAAPRPSTFTRRDAKPRVRIESVGLLNGTAAKGADTIAMMKEACESCLAASSHDRSALDLLVSAGVYRTDFLMEPALAALLAGAIGTNDGVQGHEGRKTLAFDVINGGLGLLDTCLLAADMIRGGRVKTVMVAASEVENNATVTPDHLRGVREAASALILSASPDGETGFGAMYIASYPAYAGSLRVFGRMRQHRVGEHLVARLFIEKHPGMEEQVIACIKATVDRLLAGEGLAADRIKAVLPPQVSPGFIVRLADALGWPREKFVDVSAEGDLFTSSLPFAFARLRDSAAPARGDIALIINAASGIEVGCALYHF